MRQINFYSCVFLAFFGFVLFILFSIEVLSLEQKPVEDALKEYLTDYLRVYPKRFKKVEPLIPSLVEISKQNSIDPILLATTISMESSWVEKARNPVRGEYGLTQVHGEAAKGFDLSHSIGQIRAGASWLGRWQKACGDELGAINKYMTGKRCSPVAKPAKHRYRVYLKIKKTYCPNGCS